MFQSIVSKIFIIGSLNQVLLKTKNNNVTLSKVCYKTSPFTSKNYQESPNLFVRSSTLLVVKNSIVHTSKRHHSGISIINNITKILSPQMLLEQKKLIQDKTIFSRYCEYLKNKSLSDLLDDKMFITYVHDSVHKKPTLFSRAFQLALEVTFFKRPFSEKILQQNYRQNLIIKDPFNINNGICNQSTIYTAVLAKKARDYLNLNSEDIVVNSTPIFLTKQKITVPMKNVMDYNKQMTRNTCPDLDIKSIPYDFKEPKEMSFGKNQIYFIDLKDVKEKGINILLRLEKSLENSLSSSQIQLSKKAEDFTLLVIDNLQKQRKLQSPVETRIEMLNELFVKSNIPKDFRMPLFIPAKKVQIDTLDIEKDNLDNVPLEKGFLDSVKAKKAIMGVLQTYDSSTKSNIEKATYGSIQFKNTTLDDVD